MRTVEIEVYTETHFITGEVEYDIEIDDQTFDYEYGSEKGTAGNIYVDLGECDISQLKVYDIDADEADLGAISNYEFTTDDLKLIYKEVSKDLPTIEQLKDEAKCP